VTVGKQFADVPCKYGAPMGRREFCDDDQARCQAFRVRLVDVDYDDGGAYWGGGSPLYCVRDRHDQVQLFFRAPDRNAAIAMARAQHPDLRFFRG
jgi:hypothetical protein